MLTLLSDSKLFARLVGFDSTSARSNLPLADFLCDYLDRPGVRIRRNPSPDGEKVNLVLSVGPPVDEERRGLVLSAHMDVVPAGEGWTSDPFTLTDRGDRWLGRGTADMKGFLALAVNALARSAGEDLAAPLVLLLSYDEELGCLGAQQLVETWPEGEPLPRNAVIGEPTELAAVSLHKGHLKLRVTLHGESAHSGYPHLGRNAIEPAGPVLLALSALRQELAAERPRHGEHFPETPFVALNVARIAGGGALNVVPDRCVIELGLRPLPEMDTSALRRRVEEAVLRAAPERCEVQGISESPAMLLPPRAPLLATVCSWVGQERIAAASYGTDAGCLQRLGLDCLVCGPGTIEVAHKPDEYLLKEDFAAGRAFVDRLLATYVEGDTLAR